MCQAFSDVLPQMDWNFGIPVIVHKKDTKNMSKRRKHYSPEENAILSFIKDKNALLQPDSVLFSNFYSVFIFNFRLRGRWAFLRLSKVQFAISP